MPTETPTALAVMPGRAIRLTVTETRMALVETRVAVGCQIALAIRMAPAAILARVGQQIVMETAMVRAISADVRVKRTASATPIVIETYSTMNRLGH